MERQNILLCLGVFVVALTRAVVVDPRGARPMEHGTKADKCATQKEWPFCSDDDWNVKCPSGCRIQGLMDKYDHELLKKIESIRKLLAENQASHRVADQGSKQTYDNLREKLILDAGNDNTYYDLAQNLRQRIVDMKIKIDRQLRTLGAMKERVKDQVIQMQRLEVDVDMKLRACKGSCQSYNEYSVDKDSYVALEKQVSQLDAHAAQSIETVSTMYVMKSRALKDEVVSDKYKSKQIVGAGDAGQTQDFFPDVKIVALTLEEEGASPSSPATVSKVPGTHYSSSSSSSSSSPSPSGSGGSLTELSRGGGRGDGGDLFPGGLGGGFEAFTGGQPSTHHVSTHTSSKSVACTRTTRKTVVHTADGPVEKTEEVTEGGPECQVVGSAKGSPFDTKTAAFGSKTSFSGISGMDLGGFFTDLPEEDVPDFQARSVHSTRVERQADYVGKDCADIRQKHLTGETSGLFKVKPGSGSGSGSGEVVEVYCQQGGLMGGWLLVQQRESGALSFNRSWAEYRGGFGSVDAGGKGELWLGNQRLHLLTGGAQGAGGETMLRVELEDWEGGAASAEYTVSVGSEAEGYALRVSGYAGDAGDALLKGVDDPRLESFLSHGGMRFSTFDRDNDRWAGESCAEAHGGGWWYNNCQSANLNGVYYGGGRYDPGSSSPYEIENGVVWVTYKPADYSLKAVRMFIRPAAF